MKLGTGSVFRRLFLLFLAIVIAVYCVLMVMFTNYVRKQRQVEYAGHISSVTNSASVLDQQMKAVQNVQAQYFNDVRVTRLAYKLYSDDYERSKLILDLINSMQNTKFLNAIISDIVILFPEQGIQLSAESGFHRQQFSPDMFQDARSTARAPLVLHDGHVEMNIVWGAYEESELPYYEIHVILSEAYLDTYLDSFRKSSLEGAFWVLQDAQGELSCIFSQEQEMAHMRTWSQLWTKAGNGEYLEAEGLCEDGEYWFVSQAVVGYNLTLVTYKNAIAVAWKLGSEIFYIGLTVLCVGLLFGFFILKANQTINKPIRKIMEAFRKVSSGDLKVHLDHQSNDEFGYIYDAFNDTVVRLKNQIDRITEQKTLLQKAELMQLQSQINPHFLYNSFYNLKFLAHNEEYEQIETLVTALAKYYRFLNKQTSLVIPLSEEVAHMENYIEIQQMRFGDKISVSVQKLPEELGSFCVPKLILQPIIENAYNYGLQNTLSGGLLTVRYQMEEKRLCIVIEDNGGEMTQERLEALSKQTRSHEGDAGNHAMANIQRRLELAYGEPCGLALAIGVSNGLQVILKLDTTVCLQ